MVIAQLMTRPLSRVYNLAGGGNKGELAMFAVVVLLVVLGVLVVLQVKALAGIIVLTVWFTVEFVMLLFVMLMIIIGGLGKR